MVWVSEFLEALRATGKMPHVTAEHVALVNRDHPKADLAVTWRDVVAEVSGIAGPAQNTVQVLRKCASRIELAKLGKTNTPPPWKAEEAADDSQREKLAAAFQNPPPE